MNAAHTAWGRFRDDVLAVMRAGSADQCARLTWSAERIKRAQRDALHHCCCTPPKTRRSTVAAWPGSTSQQWIRPTCLRCR